MTLSVAAFDNRGQSVTDLKSDEFQVSDEGKPQSIVSFRLGANAPRLAPPSRATKAARATGPASATVILFDLLDADMSDRGYGKDEIVHSLERLESSNSIYLYLLTSSGGVYPVHALSGPGQADESSVEPWTEKIRPLLDLAIDKVYGLRTEGISSIDTAFAALDALSSIMTSIPGRKDVIWITHGVPYDSAGVRALATRLDRSGITLSSVYREGRRGVGNIDALDELAKLTGGAVYSDLDKAIAEATNAARSTYIIQYAAPRADGKYHKIRVNCSRKGVRLRLKEGYYANR